MNRPDFLPIILGSDDNAYGTARLIYEKYSIKPLLLCSRTLRVTAHSKIFKLKVITGLDSAEVFPEALKAVLTEYSVTHKKIVVIPCSDYYLYMLVDNYEFFDGMIANRFPTRELMSVIDTKDGFYSVCDRIGLPYPKTFIIRPDEREGALGRSGLSYPLIVKPENSNATEYLNINFEGKKKVYYIESEEEYEKIAASLTKLGYKGKLIAQEFIHGDDSCMRTVNCYSDFDGTVRAASLGQPILEEYSPKTLGNYAAIISRYDKDIYDMVTRFLRETHYVGFSNFDIKIDSVSGKPYFFEINPRLGRSSFFVHGAGLNMLGIMIDDVIYGIRNNPVFTDRTFLWCNVPKYVIDKYCAGSNLKSEVNKLWFKNKYERTLVWKKDMNPKRALVLARHAVGYIRAYKRYFFKK